MGASFDTIEEQKGFADNEGFPYQLISDSDKSIGEAYAALRTPDMQFYEAGIPRRITYLIAPDGMIAKTYDMEVDGSDLEAHANQVLEDIKALA